MNDNGRLPADVYPADMGGYPNPSNPELNADCCGVPEGAEHDRTCLLRGRIHVSFSRWAFEMGYRLGVKREEAFMKAFLESE